MFYYSTRVNYILIAAAVIPAVLLLLRINRADKLEKEPPRLLISLVIFGIFSTFLAMITEQLGMAILGAIFPEGSLTGSLLLYYVVVGGSEEGIKYLLLKKRTWKNPNFNCQFDGVVYAVYVSLGFALWENISYVLTYGLGTALVRAVTAVPGHACFGVFMGAFYGLAKRAENAGDPARARRCRRMAFWVPLLIHGTYDFITTLDASFSSLLFVAFIGILFAVAMRLVKKQSREDRYIA